MSKTKSIKKLSTLVLAVFLSSCSSSSTVSSNEESLDSSIGSSSESSFYDEGASLLLYQELEKAEQLSLSKDCLGFDLVIEERVKNQYSNSNLTFDYFKDEYDNQVVSYRDNTDINHDYVYYDVDGWEYTYSSETFERIVSMRESTNTLVESAGSSSLINDIEETLNDIKLSIEKTLKDGIDTYTITIHEFDALFHEITSNAYLEETELVLPTSLEIISGVKDDLLVYEKCELNFTLSGKQCRESIRIDYHYPDSMVLPKLVRELVLNNIAPEPDQVIGVDNIVKIIPNTKEKKLEAKENLPSSKLVQYYEPEFLNQDKITRFFCDNYQYAVLFNSAVNGNKFIQVYDINTLNKVCDVIFNDPISTIDVKYGKLMISFSQNPSLKGKYYIYSLEDFSLIYVTTYNGTIYQNNYYYQCYENGEDCVKVYNFVTKEMIKLYGYNRENLPPYTAGTEYYITIDEEINVLFFWNIINSSDVHYCGYDLKTNELLYDKQTSSMTGHTSDTNWLDHGLTFKGYDKRIDGLSGEVVDYQGPKNNYLLPETFNGYIIENTYHISDRFVYMWLTKQHSTSTIEDRQFWIYDVTNETLFAEVAFQSFYQNWIVNNRIIVAYDSNEKAILKLVIQ